MVLAILVIGGIAVAVFLARHGEKDGASAGHHDAEHDGNHGETVETGAGEEEHKPIAPQVTVSAEHQPPLAKDVTIGAETGGEADHGE